MRIDFKKITENGILVFRSWNLVCFIRIALELNVNYVRYKIKNLFFFIKSFFEWYNSSSNYCSTLLYKTSPLYIRFWGWIVTFLSYTKGFYVIHWLEDGHNVVYRLKDIFYSHKVPEFRIWNSFHMGIIKLVKITNQGWVPPFSRH